MELFGNMTRLFFFGSDPLTFWPVIVCFTESRRKRWNWGGKRRQQIRDQPGLRNCPQEELISQFWGEKKWRRSHVLHLRAPIFTQACAKTASLGAFKIPFNYFPDSVSAILIFMVFFLVFTQTWCRLCTHLHVSNQHYVDRICSTEYHNITWGSLFFFGDFADVSQITINSAIFCLQQQIPFLFSSSMILSAVPWSWKSWGTLSWKKTCTLTLL